MSPVRRREPLPRVADGRRPVYSPRLMAAKTSGKPPLVALKDVRLQDGPRPLFDGVDIAIEPRTRAALVGRTGAGKSTLMKLVMGLAEPDALYGRLRPRGLSAAPHLPARVQVSHGSPSSPRRP